MHESLERLPSTPRMPALFVGHGSPMNAIEDNGWSRTWQALGERLPRPNAILCVSAHWMTRGGTLVHTGAHPRTIHDFGGFPAELFAQRYPAPGSPAYAEATIALPHAAQLRPDLDWGLDHGAWSVLIRMFPRADIPVFQLSLDLSLPMQAHYALARELKPLREKGVLVVGSGNLVHNLRMLAPGRPPYDWAVEFDARMAAALESGDFQSVVDAEDLGAVMRAAHPTTEHFLPVLYTLGVADEADRLSGFNEGFDLASISMRSFVLA
ncbi:4,5-DOPA dioxygenase extradiol [Dokdonella sp.]|uniref:4,5-DOPA-extradiol-dioxygenase n=1 Tax=Dokdonella sp. TaxID=2291710 RepID=UPI00260F9433|nr:4,5-DOPA dioxygenase extradiol [Dokdonella sp.]